MTHDWPADALDALTNDDVYLGHGPLNNGVHIIRALCRDSLSARRLMEGLRTLLYSRAGIMPPNLGRIFC
jgi:urease accessory protein